MELTERERSIIVAALDVVTSTYPMLHDLIDPAAQLKPADLADIRDLRQKIGATL